MKHRARSVGGLLFCDLLNVRCYRTDQAVGKGERPRGRMLAMRGTDAVYRAEGADATNKIRQLPWYYINYVPVYTLYPLVIHL